VAEGVGVAAADGVAVGERVRCGVSVGDTDLVGVSVGVVIGGDVVRAGSDEVEGCPVVEGLPTVAVCVGLTST
jgi:hypothetical protein